MRQSQIIGDFAVPQMAQLPQLPHFSWPQFPQNVFTQSMRRASNGKPIRPLIIDSTPIQVADSKTSFSVNAVNPDNKQLFISGSTFANNNNNKGAPVNIQLQATIAPKKTKQNGDNNKFTLTARFQDTPASLSKHKGKKQTSNPIKEINSSTSNDNNNGFTLNINTSDQKQAASNEDTFKSVGNVMQKAAKGAVKMMSNSATMRSKLSKRPNARVSAATAPIVNITFTTPTTTTPASATATLKIVAISTATPMIDSARSASSEIKQPTVDTNVNSNMTTIATNGPSLVINREPVQIPISINVEPQNSTQEPTTMSIDRASTIFMGQNQTLALPTQSPQLQQLPLTLTVAQATSQSPSLLSAADQDSKSQMSLSATSGVLNTARSEDPAILLSLSPAASSDATLNTGSNLAPEPALTSSSNDVSLTVDQATTPITNIAIANSDATISTNPPVSESSTSISTTTDSTESTTPIITTPTSTETATTTQSTTTTTSDVNPIGTASNSDVVIDANGITSEDESSIADPNDIDTSTPLPSDNTPRENVQDTVGDVIDTAGKVVDVAGDITGGDSPQDGDTVLGNVEDTLGNIGDAGNVVSDELSVTGGDDSPRDGSSAIIESDPKTSIVSDNVVESANNEPVTGDLSLSSQVNADSITSQPATPIAIADSPTISNANTIDGQQQQQQVDETLALASDAIEDPISTPTTSSTSTSTSTSTSAATTTSTSSLAPVIQQQESSFSSSNIQSISSNLQEISALDSDDSGSYTDCSGIMSQMSLSLNEILNQLNVLSTQIQSSLPNCPPLKRNYILLLVSKQKPLVKKILGLVDSLQLGSVDKLLGKLLYKLQYIINTPELSSFLGPLLDSLNTLLPIFGDWQGVCSKQLYPSTTKQLAIDSSNQSQALAVATSSKSLNSATGFTYANSGKFITCSDQLSSINAKLRSLLIESGPFFNSIISQSSSKINDQQASTVSSMQSITSQVLLAIKLENTLVLNGLFDALLNDCQKIDEFDNLDSLSPSMGTLIDSILPLLTNYQALCLNINL